ncbi:hypothetical protein GE09DRAFT_160683 [Coniochaeta sp. 2T2.1]|nr:hypothetical protein GE09DRAFT_160683 [Coniochaeta sp. 2T2.1]
MVEIQLQTPLAEALNMAIQPKLSELGWGSGGADDTAMAEYIVLMLVNGKTQDEIAGELSADFLQLGPDDPSAKQFVQWLFEQIDVLNAQIGSAAPQQPAAEGAPAEGAQDDYSMDDASMADAAGDLINAPTGPKSMRGGNNMRGGREKRMMGQINRTLNQSSDSVLHRTRGQSGIQRGPPTGPRMGAGRQPRVANNRAAVVGHGLAAQGIPGFQAGPGAMNGRNPSMGNGWGMVPPQPNQFDMMAMLQEQQMMIQQMIAQQGGAMPNGQPPNGKSLFERVQQPPHNNFRGRGGARGGARGGQHNGHHNNGGHHNDHISQSSPKPEGSTEGADVDMGSQSGQAQLSPEETMCKFNLACTNRDCKFAHQSPVAPPGITVDVKDVCSFGAACKNRKCVGRHPSPANKVAHQSEQDCKFYPNCTNPRCQFRHPAMPPCRNGGECKVPNCKFTHVKTQCRFRPCTNRFCPFSHEEGQRGTFHDKVWVAGEEKEHVSERKFVDENAKEETVLPDTEMGGAAAGGVPSESSEVVV